MPRGSQLTHRGFGTSSSGTGVQMDSGDFCSRKRPSKTAATWAMSKAQTAEPGMLGMQTGVSGPWHPAGLSHLQPLPLQTPLPRAPLQVPLP